MCSDLALSPGSTRLHSWGQMMDGTAQWHLLLPTVLVASCGMSINRISDTYKSKIQRYSKNDSSISDLQIKETALKTALIGSLQSLNMLKGSKCIYTSVRESSSVLRTHSKPHPLAHPVELPDGNFGWTNIMNMLQKWVVRRNGKKVFDMVHEYQIMSTKVSDLSWETLKSKKNILNLS